MALGYPWQLLHWLVSAFTQNDRFFCAVHLIPLQSRVTVIPFSAIESHFSEALFLSCGFLISFSWVWQVTYPSFELKALILNSLLDLYSNSVVFKMLSRLFKKFLLSTLGPWGKSEFNWFKYYGNSSVLSVAEYSDSGFKMILQAN